MSTYVIGDIQGCFDELQKLLEKISFDPEKDRLWFAGDLVNRGPKSLETLRFVKSLGKAANSVLGNHDLHLLAISQGNLKHASGASLDPILKADDCEELLHWLRFRPMLLHDEQLGFTLIHAGLPPQWDLSMAKQAARELEVTLQGEKFSDYCEKMYGNKPNKWSPDLSGMDRLRFITNCFTRLRFCDAEGKLGLSEKGAPGSQDKKYLPWFEIKGRKTAKDKILFGHWSMLGLMQEKNIWSLDTGCLWGGQLTALRLEDEKIFQVNCKAKQNPHKFK